MCSSFSSPPEIGFLADKVVCCSWLCVIGSAFQKAVSHACEGNGVRCQLFGVWTELAEQAALYHGAGARIRHTHGQRQSRWWPSQGYTSSKLKHHLGILEVVALRWWMTASIYLLRGAALKTMHEGSCPGIGREQSLPRRGGGKASISMHLNSLLQRHSSPYLRDFILTSSRDTLIRRWP